MELDGNKRRLLKKMVYDKFPITKGEMQCLNEKRTMNELRENYKKKILEQWRREKAEY